MIDLVLRGQSRTCHPLTAPDLPRRKGSCLALLAPHRAALSEPFLVWLDRFPCSPCFPRFLRFLALQARRSRLLTTQDRQERMGSFLALLLAGQQAAMAAQGLLRSFPLPPTYQGRQRRRVSSLALQPLQPWAAQLRELLLPLPPTYQGRQRRRE